jgi:hypothetical protein
LRFHDKLFTNVMSRCTNGIYKKQRRNDTCRIQRRCAIEQDESKRAYSREKNQAQQQQQQQQQHVTWRLLFSSSGLFSSSHMAITTRHDDDDDDDDDGDDATTKDASIEIPVLFVGSYAIETKDGHHYGQKRTLWNRHLPPTE